MPVLVLGAGYLGAALAERLCARGQRVVALDNGFATDWPALERLAARHAGALRLLRGDIRDPRALAASFAAAVPVETVFLLAAQASAHPDAAPPDYTEAVNLHAPRLVLDAALAAGRPPVVYGSSFHVYGAGLEGVVDESRPYGAFRDISHLSKVYAEKLGELYAREHGIGFAPVRLGIVYGLSPVTKRDLRFVTVPHAFCLRALAGQPLRVTGSGLAPLGFIHLDDAMSALLAAPSTGYAPANAVGEVAPVTAVLDAVAAAARRLGLSVQVEAPACPSHGVTVRFDVATRLDAAGWRPTRFLEQSVAEILDYYAGVAG